MKISNQNKLIAIASGVIAFAISAPLVKVLSLLVGPAVTVILWAHFSKNETKK